MRFEGTGLSDLKVFVLATHFRAYWNNWPLMNQISLSSILLRI